MAGQTNALRRMLRPIRAVPRGARMTEALAWRQTLPRASEAAVGLAATVADLGEATTDLVSLLREWDETSVIWRLESVPLDGEPSRIGLAILDAEAVRALIEIMTLRRVTDAGFEPRPATLVDAALAEAVVAAWLDGRDAALGPDAPRARLGRQVTDPRRAKLFLDDGEYGVRRVRLSFAEGTRAGTLTLALPAPKPVAEAETAPGDRGALLRLEAEVDVALHSCRVPYRWLRDLAPGATLAVPRSALHEARVHSPDGRFLCKARLGQIHGRRAIRIALDEVALAAAPDSIAPIDLPALK